MLFTLAAITSIAVPTPRPGWFLCDAVDAPVAALVGAVANDRTAITIVPRGTGAPVTRTYTVGTLDAGMSQLHYPLTLSGKPAGDLHYVQPAVLADPAAARTPTFTSVTLGARTLRCRWTANTLFLGLDARRSFQITREGPGLVYRSFDAARRGVVTTGAGFGQSNRATLAIAGGTRDRVRGAVRFRFANAGYGYTVLVPDRGPATVRVTHGQRTIQTEPLLGYTLAAR